MELSFSGRYHESRVAAEDAARVKPRKRTDKLTKMAATLRLALFETIRIEFGENVPAKTKSHCGATPACRAYGT